MIRRGYSLAQRQTTEFPDKIPIQGHRAHEVLQSKASLEVAMYILY